MTNDMSSLGEKRFLARLLPDLNVDPTLISGFGHDASVIELPTASFNLIFKVDRASHPVSLKEGWSGYRTWGQMAVTANCSDILASGGQPTAFMMAIMVPGTERESNVRDIIFGAADECLKRGVVYAGGDTKEARDSHVVGTVVGVIEKDGFLPRNTAKPGDQLFCAGLVGGFAGAYFMLKSVPEPRRDYESAEYVEYLASPVAQWDVALAMNSRKLARCGMDASDGILDVLQTFSTSGVQIVLDVDSVPYHSFATECASKTEIARTQFIFGGGDWNILYCVPPERADELRGLKGLYHVGEVRAGHGVIARNRDGQMLAVQGVINEHFRNRIEDASDFMSSIEKGNFIQ